MKGGAQKMADLLRAPPADVRLYLFYGADGGGARSAAEELADRLLGGGDMRGERISFTQADLRDAPGRLRDEAAAISMFGGPRLLWVDDIGGNAIVHSVRAAEALLAHETAGDPVVMLAGDLKATHALVKAVASAPAGLALGFAVPTAAEARKIAERMCGGVGLEPTDEVARLLGDLVLTERNIAAREIEKYALYLGATPETPQPLGQETVDAIGVPYDEGAFPKLVSAISGGKPDAALREHGRLLADGIASVGQVRAVQRRFVQILERHMGQKSWGAPVDGRELAAWSPAAAERALNRLRELEIDQKSSGTLNADLMTAEVFSTLARFASKRGR